MSALHDIAGKIISLDGGNEGFLRTTKEHQKTFLIQYKDLKNIQDLINANKQLNFISKFIYNIKITFYSTFNNHDKFAKTALKIATLYSAYHTSLPTQSSSSYSSFFQEHSVLPSERKREKPSAKKQTSATAVKEKKEQSTVKKQIDAIFDTLKREKNFSNFLTVFQGQYYPLLQKNLNNDELIKYIESLLDRQSVDFKSDFNRAIHQIHIDEIFNNLQNYAEKKDLPNFLTVFRNDYSPLLQKILNNEELITYIESLLDRQSAVFKNYFDTARNKTTPLDEGPSTPSKQATPSYRQIQNSANHTKTPTRRPLKRRQLTTQQQKRTGSQSSQSSQAARTAEETTRKKRDYAKRFGRRF